MVKFLDFLLILITSFMILTSELTCELKGFPPADEIFMPKPFVPPSLVWVKCLNPKAFLLDVTSKEVFFRYLVF